MYLCQDGNTLLDVFDCFISLSYIFIQDAHRVVTLCNLRMVFTELLYEDFDSYRIRK